MNLTYVDVHSLPSNILNVNMLTYLIYHMRIKEAEALEKNKQYKNIQLHNIYTTVEYITLTRKRGGRGQE